MTINDLTRAIDDHIRVFEKMRDEYLPMVQRIGNLMRDTLKGGNKILVAGNGGSAADAQHFAAELVGRYMKERDALPAIALTTDTSILTAIGNDYGYDRVFDRQVAALGGMGDLFIAISTSGNSKNLVLALETAKSRGMVTIGLLGKDGGQMRDLTDFSLVVPSDDTPRIQEVHEWVLHSCCELVDNVY